MRQGDPVFAWAVPRPGSALSGVLALVTPDGKTASKATAFPCPVPEAASLVGVAVGMETFAKPGVWTLAFAGTLDGAPYERRLELPVAERAFPTQTIKLDAKLTQLRTKPSPEQQAESELYSKILSTFDPSAVYLKDAFIVPTVDKRRSSTFGDTRNYRYSNGKKSVGRHLGIDFAAAKGTAVVACGSARVAFAGLRILTGNTVILEHLPGVFTIYMHMDSLAVQTGALVLRGEPIGTLGSTGFSTGPHLHWELQVAYVACDPEALLDEGPLDKIRRLITMSASPKGR